MTTKTAITAEVTRTENAIFADITHGKKQVFIGIHVDYVQVIVNNAAHKCYRGSGKHFQDMTEARKNYKTESMRLILDYADRLNA